jgi:diguanylate cyclase
MTDDAQRWKEKYLKSIENQDALERRWNARLDLLRLGLVRSTLAAEGSDSAVDQCMKEMREVVRSDNMDAALADLMPRLEKTLLASEQRRESRLQQIGGALTALVDQLQSLPLPRDAAKPLKKFAGGLDKRVGQVRELPLLLSELSELQSSALASLDTAMGPARPGLLERLFRSRDADPPAEPPAAPILPAPACVPLLLDEQRPCPADDEPELEERPRLLSVEPAPCHEVETQLDDAQADGKPALPVGTEPALKPPPCPGTPTALLDILPLPYDMAQGLIGIPPETEADSFGLPVNQEPSYSSVAAHIEGTLLTMLDDLVLPQRLLEKAQSMRERLDRGLNWYELLPLLDDLAVMVLAINDNGQQELQRYLQDINERLAGFQDHLHQASQGQADTQDEARQLDTELREQVGGLHQSVAAAEDADGLKRLLESRLDGLLGSMDAHRRRREAREQEVAERMRGLSERVANMEREAEAYRDGLEQQRQKALLDPLTGLPNRAGWNERLEELLALREGEQAPAQVAIMDLDHFKSINDGYGHLAGDRVLKIVADQLRRQLREGDFLARFGGEEFVALFPGSAPQAALEVLEKMRQVIEACPFHFKGVRIVVTVSIGVAALRPKEQAEAAVQRADQALYRAKDTGRNRIEST